MDGVQRAPRVVQQEPLDILLQHPIFSTNQRLLSSMPQICKLWQSAVKEANTLALDAHVSLLPDSRDALASFCAWLPDCSRLVRTITVKRSRHFSSKHLKELRLMNQALSQCIELAVARESVAGGTGLQLVGFSSDLCCDRNVLRSLPGNTVTYLELGDISDKAAVDVAVGLTSLQNLRDLRITGTEKLTDVDGCVAAISNLSRLTKLVLQMVQGFNSQLLPVQLQDLEVHYGDCYAGVDADFSHLAQLTSLELSTADEQTRFTGIPPQLEVLTVSWVHGPSVVQTINNLAAATRLRKVTIDHAHDTVAHLLVLQQLQSLQHLQLSYTDADRLTEAVTPLHHNQLPALVNFRYWEGDDISPGALTSAIQFVACAATGLTRLELGCPLSNQAEPPMALCGIVALFTQLRGLSMCFEVHNDEIEFVPHDVMQLASLTKLTQLKLERAGNFIDDEDVVVLACRLQQLRSLTVPISSTLVLRTIDLCGSRNLAHLAVAGLRQLPSYLYESHIKTVELVGGVNSDTDSG